jgi:hypothetical protein
MPDHLEVLAHQGAAEIWHKHGTFRDHLLGVWRTLAAWGMDRDTCRLGLFHSCYANSFVRQGIEPGACRCDRHTSAGARPPPPAVGSDRTFLSPSEG